MPASSKIEALIQGGALDRLPVTFSAFWFEQIREWELLFPAEQSYFERLLTLLGSLPRDQADALFAGVRAAEVKMGVDERTWPKRRFTLDQIDFLNRNPHYPEWRAAIANVFSVVDPALDAEIQRHGHARLVIVLSPPELPVGPDRMWLRVAGRGARIPLEAPENIDDYLPLLLTGAAARAGQPDIAGLYAHARNAPFDTWMVEAGSRLKADDKTIHLSYAKLGNYRKRLMTEVNEVVQSRKVTGPRELSARLKQMKLLPGESGLAGDPVVAEFTRATLLSGNGTLLINNTFVEWATVQAVRRARPSVMVVSFGIRNKVKPFTSLLIYEDQEAVSAIPTQGDMLGSYVDLEVFYQYIWQEFEKYPEYRSDTAFIFAAEGMDELLAIAPDDFPLKRSGRQQSLAAVHGHMKSWMNL
jgi:hypothetical protein